MFKRVALVMALLLAGSAVRAQERPMASDLPLEKQAALITATRDSFVIVAYTLQYDKGDAPQGHSIVAGSFHFNGFEDLVREERPLEGSGVLFDATHLVTQDLEVHPRFIKEIKVRRFTADGKSAESVSARISAYPREQNAVILELSAPLGGGGVKPAVFDPQRAGPYSCVEVGQDEGRWVAGVQSFGRGVVVIGPKQLFGAERGLVVDKDGSAVGYSTGIELPIDGSWKMSPAQWPAISREAMQTLLTKVESQAARGIVPVTLNFRSPRNSGSREDFMAMRDPQNAAIQHALGVVTGEHSLLILAEIKPTATARLERIRVLTNPPVDARFKATLRDYGALVAETEQTLTGGPGLSAADVQELRGAAIPSASIVLQGEKRVAYFQPRRISGFNVGWRGNLYPEFQGHDEKGIFLFDPEGRLLALPVTRREPAGAAERYRSDEPLLTPVAQLSGALIALKDSADPNNVPLTEEQENRIAWLGVELQPLTQELARANNVSDQTSDGETGGLVTFVYPDSPAARAGVEPGWVLLRINVAGHPKPIDVHVEQDRFSDEPFPWDRLNELPEAAFDRVPTPWPGADTPLIRTLTDLGFGMKFVVDFAHGGTLDKKDFTVVQGPASYGNAPKFKHAGLGLTVRDLTYEVRRYMQKKNDDPGVVISKIEVGSKASISGLKPYEVITHVNDQPVMNVQDFERLSRNQSEFRLSVKRMTKGRIVKITVAASTTEPAR